MSKEIKITVHTVFKDPMVDIESNNYGFFYTHLNAEPMGRREWKSSALPAGMSGIQVDERWFKDEVKTERIRTICEKIQEQVRLLNKELTQ